MRSHIKSAITEHTAYLQKMDIRIWLCFRRPDKLLSSWRKPDFDAFITAFDYHETGFYCGRVHEAL